MAKYDSYNNLESLTAAYGYDMKLHGKSMYWSAPRDCPDTTQDLRRSKVFQCLSSGDQNTILEYGHLMKRLGMGCYQERGANADLYDRYRGADAPNPFAGKTEKIKLPEAEPEGNQPGE